VREPAKNPQFLACQQSQKHRAPGKFWPPILPAKGRSGFQNTWFGEPENIEDSVVVGDCKTRCLANILKNLWLRREISAAGAYKTRGLANRKRSKTSGHKAVLDKIWTRFW
jgi:hypothetical protein